MSLLSMCGSTSRFIRIQPGIVLKYDAFRKDEQTAEQSAGGQLIPARTPNCFVVERQIYEHLGKHPRIIEYLGYQDKPGLPPGLLLAEASHGSLQKYLENHDTVPLSIQKKWCRQVIESISYIHQQGVIHSDLRPDNLLVHATAASLDLYLCDFGGSTCEKLGLDGGSLPDSGFSDPNSECVSTETTDIFSVASVLYTILTGHWPYRSTKGFFDSVDEFLAYMQMVDNLFEKRTFPSDVHALWAGGVILKGWMNEYMNIDDMLQALDMTEGPKLPSGSLT
ncbi:kinase-like protein [Daldinia caldariorum]|uniref:kinase-like protein n=1 Tax=Daldinia caldariorum TaxID=326644 RepID=UPI0020081BA5|nr:kinase-like protein [Daldinia caldariorum]KAI1465579.1 kinase-like protein [Daldinia caldariorum]